MIATQKKSIDIVQTIEAAGVELKKRGRHHVGLCPFHPDRNPSFFVFDDGHCHCFSCGFHQDVIGFVMEYYNLSFLDALKFLGIEQGRITPEIKREIERLKHRAEIVRKFRDWERRYCSYVSHLWRKTKRLIMNGIPSEDLDLYTPLFHMLPIWEYHRDILINGSDKLKFELYKDKEAHGKFQLRKAT